MATILLLALTVTLFASIFAWVTTFPSPAPQNNNQFRAALVYTSNGQNISAVQITHLGGPSIPGIALVYLKSAVQPSAPEFSAPYTVASQSLSYATVAGFSTWNLGQMWVVTFTNTPADLPSSLGNITVYVVSASQLLFSVILPGAATSVAPTVVSTWTVPAIPTIGQAFTVNASLAGNYNPLWVYVNLASLHGASGTAEARMSQNSQGVWGFKVNSGNTSSVTAGTYYGFVNTSSVIGQGATGAVVITIAASSSGGSSNGPLSVAAVLIPSPANAGVTEAVTAVVTYTGSTSGASLSVSFSGTPSPSGPATYSGTGPSGLTISGPSSETVLSQVPWTIPNPASITLYTYTLTATATVTGVGTVTGTLTFTPATITASVSSGLVGSAVTVTGAGFSTITGSAVALSVGGVSATISSCSAGTLSANTVTPATGGGFTCAITVPNGAPAGATTVLASDAASGQNDTAAYTVTSWSVTVGPSPTLEAGTLTARGTGFAATSSVTLTFQGLSVGPSGTTNSTCTFSGTTITTTSTGTFVCRFVVPNAAVAGSAALIASDTTYPAQVASATATVTAAAFTLSVTSGVQATSVTITATGYAASQAVSLTFGTISVTVSSCSVGTAGATITTSTAGAFTCIFTVPYGTLAGSNSVVASDSTTGQVVSSAFTVTAWTLSVSPGTGAHGTATAVTMTGAGFAVSSTVQLWYNGAVITPSSCSSGTITGTNTVVITSAGGFVCAYTVPTQTTAGTYLFEVIDITSGQTATFAFVRS